MSEQVTIWGNAQEIKRKLLTVSFITRFRKDNGWPALQPDEKWWYETEQDPWVCDKCLELEAMAQIVGMSGDYIADILIENHVADESDPMLKNIRRPETHLTFDGEEGSAPSERECRCFLHWMHPARTLAERLIMEIEEVLT